MEYVDVETAKTMAGLRLALTRGVPGPWSEAAKAVLALKHVPYTPVAQLGGQDNPELIAWTGHRNAPVAVYNDEPPRVRWLEILHLAERLGSGPPLIPADIHERMSVIALSNEICGESGFAWTGRLLMLAVGHRAQGDAVLATPMYREYGYSEAAVAGAASGVRAFLDYLAGQVKRQRDAGSDYLVGAQLTAADVYWAYFSQLLEALPPEQNPMPEGLRAAWGAVATAIGDYDPVLIEQRNVIFQRHLELPLDF